jgi:photosystem II stability/assembly factor-like uncharacterized protein
MGKLLLAAAVCCIYSGLCFPQPLWLSQNSGVNAQLYKCTFVDTATGWAAGDEGVIVKTSNGGLNWIQQNSPVDFFIYSIYFLNERLGWGLANDNFVSGTAVLSTTNGGTNWSFYRYPDSTFVLYDIFFSDSLNGVMGGYGGTILRTSNGGINWQHATVDSNAFSWYPIYCIRMYNGVSLACGGFYDLAGVTWRSSDGGYNWQSSGIASEPFFDIVQISSASFVAVGGDFEFGVMMSTTTNAGADWNVEYLTTFGIARGIAKRTHSEWWVTLSLSNRFLFTTNAGVDWQTYYTVDTVGLFDIAFTDSLHGFAVGEEGKIYKYNSAMIGIQKHSDNLPTGFSLSQNYPNPFNQFTIINYQLSISSHVLLKMYDALGREVMILVDENRQPGKHEVKWNAGEHPSGVYFCRLLTQGFSETIKVLLLK